LEATYLREGGFDDRLEDITPGGRQARRESAEKFMDELASIDSDGLSHADRLTVLALRQVLGTEVTRQSCDPEVWVVDHREGIQVAFLNIVSAQPLATPEDGERMIRRWRAMEAYMDDYISNLRSGMERGRVAARPSINRTIVQLDALLQRPANEWPLYAPAGAQLDAWPEASRRAFRAAIRDAVTRNIRPAYARLRDFLRDELYASARPADAAGLASMPGGRDCYLEDKTVYDS